MKVVWWWCGGVAVVLSQQDEPKHKYDFQKLSVLALKWGAKLMKLHAALDSTDPLNVAIRQQCSGLKDVADKLRNDFSLAFTRGDEITDRLVDEFRAFDNDCKQCQKVAKTCMGPGKDKVE